MKILHVSQGYFPALGGTEWLMTRLSEELVRVYGDDVTIFTTNCYGGDAFYKPSLPAMPVGNEDVAGVHIRRFPVARQISRVFHTIQFLLLRLNGSVPHAVKLYGDGPIIPLLGRMIKKFPADIIAASSFPLLHMYTTIKASRQSNRPCIFFGGLHPEDKGGFDWPIIYKTIQDADHYIAYTKYETDYVITKGASPERISTIGLGVDPEPFHDISQPEAKHRLGFDNSPVVGYIGQIVPHKGVDTLIRAMPRIWKIYPDVRVLVAGARRTFADQLEKMVAEWPDEWRHKILFCYDFKSEIKPWLYAALDVFAYPSAFESFGIAFLEAWSGGKPVIGCRKGAIPSVINAGRDGLMIDYQDDIMLAEAIVTLIANPDWAQKLGQTGYQKVLANHTWPIVTKRFREVYSSTLEQYKSEQYLLNN
jgi:glycosyltransferase involved in cell wall biosynthesis